MQKRSLKAPKPSPAESSDRRRHILALIGLGCSRERVVERAMKELRIAESVADRLYRETTQELRRKAELDQPLARALTIERLHRDLEKLREGEIVYDDEGVPMKVQATDPITGKLLRTPTGRPKMVPRRKRNAQAIARVEALLADVEGTNAPIKVKVEGEVVLRRSLSATIASLSPEEIEAYVMEQEELEHRAARAKLLPPSPMPEEPPRKA